MIPIVTAAQMRAVEAAEFARGVSEDELGDRAALAIRDRVTALTPPGGRVLVLAGPGNNGLDGVKVHRLLRDAGVGSALVCWNRAGCADALDFGALTAELDRAALVLDGLFGIGLTREVAGEAADLIQVVNATRARRSRTAEPLVVVAVDVPSGLNADTGVATGAAIEADATITLGMPKAGLFTGRGPGLSGEIVREPIGLRADDATEMAARGFDSAAALHLPPRRVGSHKNDNGRVMVIGGSLRYPGAPVLTALSAHRAGAGYVTVGFPRSMLGPIASRLLEETLLPLPEAEIGTLGTSAVDEARDGTAGYEALVLGNGLHREEPTVAFVLELLGVPAAAQQRPVGFGFGLGERGPQAAFGRARRPVGFRANEPEEEQETRPELPPTVVDGDGLYALSTRTGWWERAPSVALLTPHPGEMARLSGREVAEVEADRSGVAREAALTWGRTVLLKGSYPVIASPDGELEILVEGHPELGSAGTGDVLAGLCGFALSLGLAPAEAARAGLVLGARAAAVASERVGRDAVGAGDVIAALPEARRRGRG